jgi:hypothetical protein
MKEPSIPFNDDMKFLIYCCQTSLHEEEKAYIKNYLLSLSNLKMTTLLEKANQHAIIPLVYKTLSSIENTPTSFLSTLKKYYMHTVQKNMMMSTELIRIMKLLDENDIEALAFKGPTLAQLAYGDITLRQYGDLDILIQKDDRAKMAQVMQKQGYISNLYIDNTVLNTLNVLPFHINTSMILSEIHWELLSKNYAIHWAESKLWAEINYVTIDNYQLPTLNFEQQFLYLCVHSSKHLFERISWICDIDRTVRSNEDIPWDSILENAKNLGILRMVYLSLSLCQKLFNLPFPSFIHEKIDKDSQTNILHQEIISLQFNSKEQQITGFKKLVFLYNIRERPKDKFLFLWHASFATKHDDFIFIKLPTYLTFLYPLIRPLRLLVKYLK